MTSPNTVNYRDLRVFNDAAVEVDSFGELLNYNFKTIADSISALSAVGVELRWYEGSIQWRSQGTGGVWNNWALLVDGGSIVGPRGVPCTVSIDSTVTSAAGTAASVENVGSESAVALKFTIPAGSASYVYFKYAINDPTTDSEVLDTPTANTRYLGCCTTTSTAAPSTYTSYTWFRYKGNDAVGISSSSVDYQAGESSTAAPTGLWSSTIPSVAPGSFLWTRVTFTMGDGSTSVAYSVAKSPEAANGISGITTTYQAGESGTTAPTGAWDSTVPAVAGGSYLWTRTVTTLGDGTTNTAYSVVKQIADAVTISSTVVTYQASASGTAVPSGSWLAAVPEVSAGQYLWSKTLVSYSNGTSSSAYGVSRIGADGITGWTRETLVAEDNNGTAGNYDIVFKQGTQTFLNVADIAVINISIQLDCEVAELHFMTPATAVTLTEPLNGENRVIYWRGDDCIDGAINLSVSKTYDFTLVRNADSGYEVMVRSK